MIYDDLPNYKMVDLPIATLNKRRVHILIGGDWNIGLVWDNDGLIMVNNHWLVVWNMNFMTFHSVGNVITPTDFHSIIFQRGRSQPPTR